MQLKNCIYVKIDVSVTPPPPTKIANKEKNSEKNCLIITGSLLISGNQCPVYY